MAASSLFRLVAVSLCALPCFQPVLALRRKSKASSNSTASCSTGGFCSCVGLGSTYDRSRPNYIWSAADVQKSVTDYYTSDSAQCQPHSAYAAAYAAMTQQRDLERCSGGPMNPHTPLAKALNDALADLMSRYFVSAAQDTASGIDIEGVWADLKSDAMRGNFNSLHYSMASTALYLTSHMGLALSALPHSDNLWRGTSYTTIQERVDAMQELYKPAYDAFNGFLADNVNVIGSSLYDAGLVSNANINIAATLVPGGGVEFFFEQIRTKTFDEGMQVALQTQVGAHPMTQRYGGIYVLATNPRILGSLGTQPGSALAELADHARFWRTWMGDGLGPVWKTLGGLSYNELLPGRSAYVACMAKQA